MIDKEKLIEILKSQQISYDIYNHPALHTVDESKKIRGKIPGAHTKNLFLKNKKNLFYLFSCLETTKIDLKTLNKELSLGNISFAKEEYLKKLLNVAPGSVTPFGLLNDINKEIKFYLDQNILSYTKVNFHPLDNRYTISLITEEFISFIKNNKIIINVIDFENYMII